MSGFKFSLIPKDVPRIETEFRRIVTPIPVPESLDLLYALEKYESVSMHGQLPVVWERAQDFLVSDAWGNQWIDFTSTIFVTNAGHGNPRILQSLRDVLAKPLLHTYTYASKERAEYLQYLIENTPAPFEKAFLVSAGTEATEAGLKLMRMAGWKKGKKRPGVICFEGNWHGRTMGAQMMGGNTAQQEWIGYLDPNIYHLPFPYPWREDAVRNPREYFRRSMEELLRDQKLDADADLCGFMIETFQGWGAIFYPAEYIQELVDFARQHHLLVAFDEMQSGFGRTGKLFGYMHYGVEPDLLCCGKGAGSSLPLALVLGRAKIMDLPEIGSMSSTHSANPMVCAAGKANLQALLEDGIIERSIPRGELFQQRLRAIQAKYPDQIRYVLGKGMVAALLFYDADGNPLSELCSRIAEIAMGKGLLVVCTGRESIKLGPPLTICDEALMEGLEVLDEAIKEALEGQP
ncbi:4-aminobutyrate aminotransferase/diaminobutyrate-pyruvate transaminase/4-aminobutyrate aminotransferase/(S)-3-amino-2-methylpropionate transaminase [Hydrogenispora ethanolica]|uniref:4-aminobutyrate aminotransferase/diaminobutyrate-pyruvate transaminase/4-aminobutyrate aminotransferase/(S)-3-amino-2-methylpropionate transaminase n=1 Tax=Hydrogenispora ethanolica TaxID=1082276 RepID=A0A4R1RV42_HYDET|nr:aspartate aminotransferase family protein [Hydrogenispora ethanolica]TCL69970.1 4-aminobutyrate aminotransferase/diaminobutyrate-pyruvate transaminase/4-aminobutyrate aminotransferase/(S)-3-amino-2-methylpropionate transaminase [Hydrogenispora ethanolica]